VSSGETASSGPDFCPSCGSPIQPSDEARFCPYCGQPLDGGHGAPHLFGVLHPGPTFVLGGVLVLAAILTLVAGSSVAAIVLAVLAAATFVLFYGAARRYPESRIARTTFTSGRRLRGWGVFGRESAGAWALATRDVSRLRAESRRLRHERKRVVLALGEAAYRENAAVVGALRLRLKEIDDGLASREQARLVSLAKARRRVHAEHVAVQPTQQFSVDELATEEDAQP